MGLEVNLVCLDACLFSGQTSFVVIPSIEGDIGVYPQHAHTMGLLRPGSVRITKEEAACEDIVVAGGIFDIRPTAVLILADLAVRTNSADLHQVEEARKMAMTRLESLDDTVEQASIEIELALLAAHIAALKRLKK